jgi:hypothetical protein
MDRGGGQPQYGQQQPQMAVPSNQFVSSCTFLDTRCSLRLICSLVLHCVVDMHHLPGCHMPPWLRPRHARAGPDSPGPDDAGERPSWCHAVMPGQQFMVAY